MDKFLLQGFASKADVLYKGKAFIQHVSKMIRDSVTLIESWYQENPQRCWEAAQHSAFICSLAASILSVILWHGVRRATYCWQADSTRWVHRCD